MLIKVCQLGTRWGLLVRLSYGISFRALGKSICSHNSDNTWGHHAGWHATCVALTVVQWGGWQVLAWLAVFKYCAGTKSTAQASCRAGRCVGRRPRKFVQQCSRCLVVDNITAL